MIGALRGALLARSADGELLVEVAGIGYRVQTATPAAGDIGSEVFLHVCHVVREGSETLYGFATLEERAVFETLLGTPGVGPALGLAILGVHNPNDLRRVAATADMDALCLVPGIGPKTATRLLMEMKSRLDLPTAEAPSTNGTAAETSGAGSVRADVRAALGALGYPPDEITRAMSQLPAGDDPAALLREALRSVTASS